MDPQLTTELITAAVSVASVGGLATLGVLAARRARARRLAEIEGAGEARPALSKPKRRGIQVEDLEPEAEPVSPAPETISEAAPTVPERAERAPAQVLPFPEKPAK